MGFVLLLFFFIGEPQFLTDSAAQVCLILSRMQ